MYLPPSCDRLAERLSRPQFGAPPRLFTAGSSLQETGQRGFSRVSVQGVGSLLEFNSVKESLNGASDRIGGHDERGIKRMDVFARHRTFGMADQGRDGHLCKAEIVGDAREAVTRSYSAMSLFERRRRHQDAAARARNDQASMPATGMVRSYHRGTPAGARRRVAAGRHGAAAMAATEAFKVAMRKLERYARNPAMMMEMFAPSADVEFALAPAGTSITSELGEFDCLSGGAITQSALYALTRLPGFADTPG
jgi:hypothetical protein